MIYYCESTGGFYEDQVNKKAIPDDKVEISAAHRLELLKGQVQGQCIVADDKGYPVLIDVQPPSEQELRAVALAKRDDLVREASTKIATLQDAVDLGEATTEEQAALIEWKRYRIALMRIDQQADFPRDIQWPAQHGTTQTN
ncbi:tail fiber assembly protein [Pseudomonas sp. CF150]|uniref:tail fiber assembly protein n=1 Tax=Pseudomonas sp. CF150 TaxID=911240 RepID=UPI0003573687|nr:tail fiber assembly protein [Pseudomonas sp. CF150]EPL07407.1 putative phage tail fiber protein [Pseudomonas sp. CF150]